MFLITIVLGAWLDIAGLTPQAPAPNAAVTEVRQTLDTARKDIDAYTAAGGTAGAADHPAIKWDAVLWTYREREPHTAAASLATAEAVRLLVRAELWDRAHARAASVGVDDPAWERLAAVIYDEGIARKDLPYTIDTLSRLVQSTTTASNKAAALVIIGRAYRRQNDKDAAVRSLESAKSAAPGSRYGEEAEGLLYEIAHLSVGLQAPAIDGKTRDGRTVTLAALRGKPVVLVFWGTT
jgi:hypothetical protein